ncbi:angiotensinogen-like [Carassius carassius]|uniref:angiotensinogen-like n=1 Tax=Carassius carassius TaxID=217509 RepID=UPI002868E302|nr:angiotensinogen-like [Carassius carassius]XP_059373546.1 angiotensinogen-like [Carassius carassius]
MNKMFLALLVVSCFALGTTNRVYVHPFNLFSSENISCEIIQNEEHKPFETIHPLTPLQEGTEPDPRPSSTTENLKNLTQRTAVLAELQNSLGLRMYQTLSRTQKHSNTLLSPLNAFGALVTLYLGASKKTAISYQQLLGLNLESEQTDCAYFIDGHTVLHTLQAISGHVDESQNDLQTLVWTFINSDADLSKDFLRGTQDFSDDSFVRAVDFSKAKEAEVQVNNFIQKTSDSKVTELFQGVTPKTDLLFASSVHFTGDWKTAFQPEATSDQKFWTHENSSLEVPFMMHTGNYMYFDDVGRKCSIVKLGLSKRTYMLLVVPNKGASLQDIEKHLLTVIPTWHRNLKEKYLELYLPKFSLTAVTDLRSVLSEMAVEKYLMGSDADFRRLSSKENFTVDKVLNKVVFEMTEGGSEVQNKTEDGRVPHKVTVNRRFFFAIVEGNSNAILMLGKIVSPTT